LQISSPDRYFFSHLPPPDKLSQSAIQLTFKKLRMMSKNFLSDETLETSSCTCQDCITEREIPLACKLQFLEESAEELCKTKKTKKVKDKKSNDDQEIASERDVLNQIILKNRTELTNYWSSITTEEKWVLTEMSCTELQNIIYHSNQWETLRAALASYTKYSWDDDRLEITDDIVTICDDLTDSKGAEATLHLMLDCASSSSAELVATNNFVPANEEEWDFKSRRMLENLVLAEFAAKIAAQFLIKTEESRAQRAALELELELLKEEEQKKINEKKAKKKKSKNKKKKKKNDNSSNKNYKDDDELENESEEEQEAHAESVIASQESVPSQIEDIGLDKTKFDDSSNMPEEEIIDEEVDDEAVFDNSKIEEKNLDDHFESESISDDGFNDHYVLFFCINVEVLIFLGS
jgi:hypothetical protein